LYQTKTSHLLEFLANPSCAKKKRGFHFQKKKGICGKQSFFFLRPEWILYRFNINPLTVALGERTYALSSSSWKKEKKLNKLAILSHEGMNFLHNYHNIVLFQ